MSYFSFNTVTREDVELEIRKLILNKASTCNSIPARNMKQIFDICGPALCPIVNHAIQDCIFPEKLKLVTPHRYIKATRKHTKTITGPQVCYQ